MEKKKLLLITTISVVVLVALLIVSPWAWFWLKGFRATNAPLALIGIMTNYHEVLNGLINKNISIGYKEKNLPPADAVWDLGDYSAYWYYLGRDPDNPNNYDTSVKIGCHNGKVILAAAVHSKWEVVFFESDVQGLKDAWDKKYGNKAG